MLRWKLVHPHNGSASYARNPLHLCQLYCVHDQRLKPALERLKVALWKVSSPSKEI